MSDVKSKNLYELLGNTSDQDSDREPDAPVKTVDKAPARSGKREAPKPAPTEPAPSVHGARGGRRGGFTGSEEAFRDRNTGRGHNRNQPTEGEDGVRPGRDSGPGTRRGGRGPRGPRRGGDRHSRTGQAEHVKQADQAWGAQTGEAEFADETAGNAIAKEEIAEGGFDSTAAPAAGGDSSWDANAQNPSWANDPNAPTGDGFGDRAAAEAEAEAEPEDTHKSYADYLAEQAAKKMEGLGIQEARKPNEGSKENKKWSSAKEYSRGSDEAYFEGEAKARRERDRERNKKEQLVVDYNIAENREEGGRGGRGRGRGRGRGDRGGDRGDRGDFRGRGRGRGDGGDNYRGRGDRGDRGDRGEYRGRGRGRGGRGGSGEGQAVAVNDETAFPSLGGGK